MVNGTPHWGTDHHRERIRRPTRHLPVDAYYIRGTARKCVNGDGLGGTDTWVSRAKARHRLDAGLRGCTGGTGVRGGRRA